MSEAAVLYLEPVGGIAGDMFLAAAVDLGVPLEALTQALSGLGVAGWRLEANRAERHEISGIHVDVKLDAGAAHVGHRPLTEIRQLIQRADTLSPSAKAKALEIFELMGRAESAIHQVPLEQIYFHEVGAVDSIVDICGAAVALEHLGNPEVFSAPPPLGSGMAKTAHGTIPLPAPATLEILRGVPVRFEGAGELTTPTGAALLKALARIGPPPEMVVSRVGYGVGTKDFSDRPNVLRASLGRLAHAAEAGTWVLEANLDDCSPQLLGALLEKALEAGALDAYVTPSTMKKSRPGHLFSAVVPANLKGPLADLLLAESTTLGVRSHRVERLALERAFEEVETPYGKIRVKLGLRDGRVLNAAPEFEDCKAAAAKSQVPVKRVLAEALAAYHQKR